MITAPLLTALLWTAAADKDVAAIEDVSLDELLGGDTTVSSTKSTRLREAPGIVTVITRDDMLRLGARDLGELLPLIPGFDQYIDVNSVTGSSFRGLYAGDGRMLLLIDGVEMNENAYGGAATFAHYPVDDIERIEILRGPGSARYGGYASLAVIHIITRGQAARNDVGVVASYGQTAVDAPFLNKAVTAMGGKHLDVLGGLDLSLSAHAGTRTQSTRDVTDHYGASASLQEVSEARSIFINASARLPWLQARLIVDGYDQEAITVYDALQESSGRTQFPAVFFDLQAPLALTPTLQITPRLSYTRQLPWRPANADDFPITGDIREVDDRLRLGTQARFEALPRLTLAGGIEGTLDNTVVPTGGDRDGDWTLVHVGDESKQYLNGAAYGEATVDVEVFLLTLGARAELHSIYGGSFVPRVALTRVFDGAHVKLLVAGSFRAPGIDNIRFAAGDIRPERTRVVEIESGLALSSAMYLTVNAFDITIHDPLIYFVDGDDEVEGFDGYTNFPQTGTRGLETTLLGTAPFGRLELSYSFATAAGKNQVPLYAVPGDDGRLLGMPQHKGVAVGSIFLAPGVTATVTAIGRSERPAQVGYDADFNAVYGELPASLLIGGALRVSDVLVRGIEGTLGVRNALGDDYRIAQPYASGHPSIPFEDRELYVRLAGHFD